ncbi:unnamed protein product [Alopecurus aequalis]
MATTSFAATGTRPALSMKLLIDTRAQRVLFAEANKDVVDFLFSLRCGTPMKDAIQCVRPDSGGSGQAANGGGAKGFVQGVVTYTVTDGLTVTPMSAISSMTLLNTLGVRDFGALQEKTVRLGSTAGLAILKASLQ